MQAIFKRIISITAAAMLCGAVLTGCSGTNGGSADSTTETSATNAPSSAPAEGIWSYSADYPDIANFKMPADGEKVAVMTVKDFGTIKIKLFWDEAPAGADNFARLAEMGYYDGLIYHRIINGFMNQGGDPTGTGTAGEGADGKKFDGGITKNAYHFSGAVAYANAGTATQNGSQFYIVNTPDGGIDDDTIDMVERYFYQRFGVEYSYGSVGDLYKKIGGTPSLDVPLTEGGYTVFGQVYEGLDIVRAIGAVQTDASDRPVTDVVIENVKIEKYSSAK